MPRTRRCHRGPVPDLLRHWTSDEFAHDPRAHSGRGPGSNSGPNGDLYILVHVDKHPVFGRDGNNVTVRLPVAFDEVALGANIKVPTPDGNTVTLKLPPGTSNGRTFRVKGKGAHPKGKTPGDLLVTVEVEVPAELSEGAREAAEAMRAARGSHGLGSVGALRASSANAAAV